MICVTVPHSEFPGPTLTAGQKDFEEDRLWDIHLHSHTVPSLPTVAAAQSPAQLPDIARGTLRSGIKDLEVAALGLSGWIQGNNKGPPSEAGGRGWRKVPGWAFGRRRPGLRLRSVGAPLEVLKKGKKQVLPGAARRNQPCQRWTS